MRGKILTLSIAILLLFAYSAMALTTPANSATPANFVVNYTVTSVTTFTVFSDTATLNFTGSRDAKLLDPVGDVNGPPWANITNGPSSVIQTFTVAVDAIEPGIELLASNFSNMNGKVTVVDFAPRSPTGWTGVAPGANVSLYAKANFSSTVPDGSYLHTLTIAS